MQPAICRTTYRAIYRTICQVVCAAVCPATSAATCAAMCRTLCPARNRATIRPKFHDLAVVGREPQRPRI